MNTVSAIVVNYNGRELLAGSLESLRRQTLPLEEIILVDNASTDGSAAYVKTCFPWVRLVALPVNTGFSGGNNAGLARASGEYVALLNSDAIADERWAEELVRALDANERIGAAVGKIYQAGADGRIEQAGAEFNDLGNVWGRGFNEPDRGQFDAPCDVPALTGCAALIRRQALGGEPLFDERFFMYGEELELSLRLRGRGYQIAYVPTAIVYHKGMQSIRQTARKPHIFQQYYCNRNRLKILAKYYPLASLVRSLPLIVLGLLYWNLQFLRRAGLVFCLRAVAAQVHFVLQGLAERLRGDTVAARGWTPWMTRHGLREVLALRSKMQEVP